MVTEKVVGFSRKPICDMFVLRSFANQALVWCPPPRWKVSSQNWGVIFTVLVLVLKTLTQPYISMREHGMVPRVSDIMRLLAV